MTKDPSQDNRIPDIVVIPNLGTMYAPADEQGIAAHGGFSDDDRHVALLLSSPGLSPRTIRTPVQTMQVAPTILQALGLDPGSLQAVQQEKTSVLPGLFAGPRSSLRLLSSE
jgi:arylsulfatase A-like enzyme